MPAAPNNNAGVLPPPPPMQLHTPTAVLASHQQPGDFATHSLTASQKMSNNDIHSMVAAGNAVDSYAHTQRNPQAPYNNQVPTQSQLGEAQTSNMLARPFMPGASNSSMAHISKESSLSNTRSNVAAVGTIQQQTSLMPSNDALQPQNTTSQHVAATQPSAYSATFKAQNTHLSVTPYGGSGISSAISSRGSPSIKYSGSNANDDWGLSSFDITSLSSEHQVIAQKLCASVQQVSNLQRRSVVSKAAVKLLEMLQQRSLSESVVQLISNYVNAAGTPAAKNEWRQLSDMHFDTIQPFFNLKFL